MADPTTVPVTVTSRVLFSDLCGHLEKLSLLPRDKKSAYLAKYIAWFREFARTVIQAEPAVQDDGFYPVLRLLLPQLDRERSAYGIKEHTLAKMYIRILCLPKEGPDAARLLHYRSPGAGAQAGDFSDVAYWVLRGRCGAGGGLSVHDVNAQLDQVALSHAARDPRGVDAVLLALLRATSALEQKWLARVLLRDARLGLGQTGVLNALHPDARELFDVTNDLSKVCVRLADPNLRLHEIEVAVNSPVRAMLAERADVSSLAPLLRTRPFFFLETKYDGERFQLHFDRGHFRYFSKNAFDFTETFGATAHAGLLTPRLAPLLRTGLASCVLDGEMMAWDPGLGSFRSRGPGFDVKGLKLGDTLTPCFCAFDLLAVDGQVLTDCPLEERRAQLERVLAPAEGVAVVSPARRVTTPTDVVEELNSAIDSRLEGIMLKDPTSVYKPNARKAGWFKIKPEYTDGLMDHLDLVIVGGYHGKRTGIVSHFMVAAAEGEGGPDSLRQFHSVGRVGSGYSNQELGELLQRLAPHWRRVRPGERPPGVEWTREKPDLWVPPHKSFVLEIKASEIQPSAAFRAGCTLRFPRVEKIRYDKEWWECATTQQLQEAMGSLCARHASVTPLASPPKRARRAPRPPAEPPRGVDPATVAPVSSLLAGRELCVLTGWGELSKGDLETKVLQHGGSVVQNLRVGTFCAVAGEEGALRVRTAVRSGQYDVAHTRWLLAALGGPPPLPPPRLWDLLASSPATRLRLERHYDQYGDGYTEAATRESLAFSLTQAGRETGGAILPPADMADLDVELFSGPSSYGMFRLCCAFPDDSVGNLLEAPALDLGFYGGKVTPQLTEDTTHVLVHSTSTSTERLNVIRDLNHKRRCKFHIVTELWIQACIRERQRLPEGQDRGLWERGSSRPETTMQHSTLGKRSVVRLTVNNAT